MNLSPTLVLFDAVGTVIKPVPGVIEIYHETGCQFGSQLQRSRIVDRFREAREKHFRRSSDSFKSSDEIERELWRQLVAYVFEDLEDTDGLFEKLWRRFASPDAWGKYADVEDCLNSLCAGGIKVAIGSNFDSRLLAICDDIFSPSTFEHVFCSSQLGYRKPAEQFYKHVEARYPDHRIVMVGDDVENDVRGPESFGWESLLLDRSNQLDHPECISSLSQLPPRIVDR